MNQDASSAAAGSSHSHVVMLLLLLATAAAVADAARNNGESFSQILSRWQRSPAQSTSGLRAASTHQNCACQCSSLTFRDNWGELHGNCHSHDNGAQWCYTTGWGSSCRDKVKSQRFANNPWSYEACSTPPLSQCGGGCGGTCGSQGSSGGYGGGGGGGCTGGVSPYPAHLPNSLYYSRLCITKHNLKVISSPRASPAALERTAYLMDNVMTGVDKRVARSMNSRGFRHAVMGPYPSELTTHIPEHAFLDASLWDERARGLGATLAVPVGSSAEENAMCHDNDRYLGEDITIHEFAHSMHLLGFSLVFPNFDTQLKGLYKNARANKLWGSGHYAMTDYKEYLAEGVQTYFDANARDAAAPTNREQLRRRDPRLFAFLQNYFGNNPWRRSC